MTYSYLIYRLRYNYAKDLNLKAPVDVSMELSSYCNMRCSYCYHADKSNLPFKQSFMSWDTAKKIIDSAKECGVHSLKMNWRGESTMNAHFAGVCLYAKKLAHGSTFIDRITNSNFKFNPNDEDIFTGLSAQTKVKISFDSFDPIVFENQRHGGIHSVTMSNIDRFYNLKGRKTEIVIQAVRTLANKDEDISGLCKSRWPDASVSIRDMVAGRVDKDLGLLENKQRQGKRQSCIQAHARLIFDHTGTATVCCPDIKMDLASGNIHQSSIKELFNSEANKKLRKSLKNLSAFTKNPCQACSSFESFEGYKHGWGS